MFAFRSANCRLTTTTRMMMLMMRQWIWMFLAVLQRHLARIRFIFSFFFSSFKTRQLRINALRWKSRSGNEIDSDYVNVTIGTLWSSHWIFSRMFCFIHFFFRFCNFIILRYFHLALQKTRNNVGISIWYCVWRARSMVCLASCECWIRSVHNVLYAISLLIFHVQPKRTKVHSFVRANTCAWPGARASVYLYHIYTKCIVHRRCCMVMETNEKKNWKNIVTKIRDQNRLTSVLNANWWTCAPYAIVITCRRIECCDCCCRFAKVRSISFRKREKTTTFYCLCRVRARERDYRIDSEQLVFRAAQHIEFNSIEQSNYHLTAHTKTRAMHIFDGGDSMWIFSCGRWNGKLILFPVINWPSSGS